MVLNPKLIVWHEEGLKNMKLYLERELKVLELQQEKVKELSASINKREKQINYAKAKKMTEFDEKSKVFERIC